MKRVEGHPGFARGSRGEIVSTDSGSLAKAQAEKAKAKQMADLMGLMQELVTEIRELKEELKVVR